MHLPGNAFMKCATAADTCGQTLFGEIKDTRNVKMDDLTNYMELVMKMFELSPEGARNVLRTLCARVGEHSLSFLSKLFQQLDEEADYNLSRKKSKRDRERWAVDEAGRSQGSPASTIVVCAARLMRYTRFSVSPDDIGGKPWTGAQRRRPCKVV